MTAVAAPPPKKPALPPAPPQMRPSPPQIGAAPKKQFSSAAPEGKSAFKIGIYGTGGVGKTSLAMAAPGPVKFIDLDDSLGALAEVKDVSVVRGVETWQDLLDALRQADLWKDVRTVVIDTATRAEELCIAHVLATIKHEKGHPVASVEGYGWGKGYKHVHETYLALFAELDRHCRAARNAILIAHDDVQMVPNPAGEDYKRWSPRLQDKSNGSIANKFKEWCDHLLYVGYDFALAAKDGKNRGNNSRTIYPIEQATFVAKSRSLRDPIPYTEGDVALWEALFGKQS